jgi:hypothetical protein
VPDLNAVFAKHGAATNPEVAATRDNLVSTISDTLTRGFRSAFAVAALLAALSLIPALMVAERRRRTGVAVVIGPALAAGAMLAGVALFGFEAAAGASTVGQYQATDPCHATADPYSGNGLDSTVQRIALGALNGAACQLHTSRERLLLSLDPSGHLASVKWDKATIEKALQAGADRAVNDAEHRGSLPGPAAAVLRFAADHAPLDWILGLLHVE